MVVNIGGCLLLAEGGGMIMNELQFSFNFA